LKYNLSLKLHNPASFIACLGIYALYNAKSTPRPLLRTITDLDILQAVAREANGEERGEGE